MLWKFWVSAKFEGKTRSLVLKNCHEQNRPQIYLCVKALTDPSLLNAVHWYEPESLGSKCDMCRVPLLTLVLPCGNGTRSLDQTIFGEGTPNAWQETNAFVPLLTVMTLFGFLVNRGGTKENKTIQKFT